jgi:tetratricopeptide (TPR) repeat protein
MRYDRPFILPERAEDAEVEAGPPQTDRPRAARLSGGVLALAAVAAAALGAWIWLDDGSRAAHSAPEPARRIVHSTEPSAGTTGPTINPLLGAPDPSVADDRVAGDGSRPSPPTAKTPGAADPADARRQAQVVEAMEQGQYYTAIGRHEVAASHYERAVELDPANASARYKAALAYVRCGRTARARREMAALEEMDPNLASLLANLLR